MPATAMQSLSLGIRFQADADDKRFMRYFDLVQQSARERGHVFFLDTVDDHCVDTEEMDLGDLAGWLVPNSGADEFSERFATLGLTDDDAELYAFAVWELDERGDVRIIWE